MGPAVATTVVGENSDGGPLGVFPTGPAVATIVVGEVINGEALGGAIDGSSNDHHHCWRRCRWRHLAPFRGPDSILCLNAY
jgi:hypothetical protein